MWKFSLPFQCLGAEWSKVPSSNKRLKELKDWFRRHFIIGLNCPHICAIRTKWKLFQALRECPFHSIKHIQIQEELLSDFLQLILHIPSFGLCWDSNHLGSKISWDIWLLFLNESIFHSHQVILKQVDSRMLREN